MGNGKYKNPVLYADYSDPDVIRVGDDYWLTASSFNHMPGLPILHSTDLVNWELVNTVFLHQEPLETFDKVTPGEGVWAPAIRYHNGEYYIYWGNPYEGVYMTKTTDPRGEWSKPHLVKKAEGIIDTCPSGTRTAGLSRARLGRIVRRFQERALCDGDDPRRQEPLRRRGDDLRRP